MLMQLGQQPKPPMQLPACPAPWARPSRVDLEERMACSGRLKRKRDTLLPLLEHAIAYLHEFRVRFNVGLQIL